MKKIFINVALAVVLLMSQSATLQAQSRKDKEQTVTIDQTYDVVKLQAPKGKKIKNVIFMVGDGMSLMHMYSAWTVNKGKLNLDNAQAVGLSKTYCANKLITDSGAGGTAFATGHKTNYHMVGTDVNGKPLPSLTDFANAKKLSTGVVVTCRLNDATLRLIFVVTTLIVIKVTRLQQIIPLVMWITSLEVVPIF